MATSTERTPEAYIASLSLDVIGETIARVDLDRFIARFEEGRGVSRTTRAARAGRSA